uniref:Fatty-acid amide hydrolase 1 n=1 Tax=Ursus maritimus TaxID=29073 RepID=A0A452VGB6_URSMA
MLAEEQPQHLPPVALISSLCLLSPPLPSSLRGSHFYKWPREDNCRGAVWTGANRSSSSALPSPQEPSLDPRAILELPLERLAQKLQDEELSLEGVLCSYLEEVGVGSGALKKLKKAERGLLYGVPVSLKDVYDCKGHDSTCGLAQFLEKPAAKDGVIVKVLKAQGAIPFVKTNIPQTLLSFQCSNPIYGQTLNPLNLKKTPGGSSGGEGAMLAQRGSILGMGTDTAGSIRIPATFCGICGFRTTGYRLSSSGISSAIKGQKTVTTVAGPMARDVESLVLCMRALLSEDMHRLDPTVPFMPFREEVYSNNQPLRIGYCESDGFTQPTPSMARAMKLTSRLLQEAGHQVIPFSIPRIEYAVQYLFLGGVFADGGTTLLEKLYVCQDSDVGHGLGDAAGGDLSPRKGLCGSGLFGCLCDLCWSLDLDVLLTPALAPAFHTGYSITALDASSYLSLYNVLNFPAGVVPVTTVTLQDEEELAFYKGYYGDTSKSIHPLSGQAVHGSVGLPVAVQCVALPWEEELCLRFMKEVETLARNHRGPE